MGAVVVVVVPPPRRRILYTYLYLYFYLYLYIYIWYVSYQFVYGRIQSNPFLVPAPASAGPISFGCSLRSVRISSGTIPHCVRSGFLIRARGRTRAGIVPALSRQWQTVNRRGLVARIADRQGRHILPANQTADIIRSLSGFRLLVFRSIFITPGRSVLSSTV